MKLTFYPIVQRTMFVSIGVVLSFALITGAAQASCPQRSTVDLLKFALANAPTNFAAIRGSAEGIPGGPYTQYTLTPAAERFCPNHFVLQHNAARGTSAQEWELKFTVRAPSSESDNDIFTGAFKELSPTLKSKGFAFSGYTRGVTGLGLAWDGPSSTNVFVQTHAADALIGTTAGFEIYVRHEMNATR